MNSVNINDQQYCYHIHGDHSNLPSLVMLHGFMGDLRVFNPILDQIASFCNPITVDLLGHGKSSKPTESSRYAEKRQIEDIAKLTNHLSLSSPAVLYGYSMGGRLALKLVLNHPEIFDALILESANCGIQDETERRERRKQDQLWGRQIKNDFSQFLSWWKDLELFESPLPSNIKEQRRYQKIQSEQTPEAMAASLGGFGAGAMQPACKELNKLELPVLLMAGSADQKYQRICSMMTGKLPESVFKSIKAGHRIHLDNPSEVVNSVKEFISSNR